MVKNIKKYNFKKIIFSDESAIERGQGARAETYRQRRNRKGKTIITSTTTSSKFFLIVFFLF